MRRLLCLKFACVAALTGGLASGLPRGLVAAAPPAQAGEPASVAEDASADEPAAGVAAPVSPELAAEVRSLLRQLDAPELARRDAAEARLLELGPSVVELLPGAGDRLSAEVRQRVERIRGKLELARAEKFVQPSRVTLQGRLKLSAILKSIAEQTGNTITDYRKEFGQDADDLEVELAIDNVDFWLALEQLLEKTDLVLYPYAEKGGLAVVARDTPAGTNPLRRFAGVFRLEPTQVVAERNLQDGRHGVQLRLAIAWEPRMKPLALWLPLESISGSDNLGNVITAGEPGSLEAPANPGTTAVELMVPLSPPPREAAKITSLKGKLAALVPGRIETFTFGDLPKARNVEQRRAGAVVVLEQVRKNNALWELRVKVRYDETGQALESHRGWVFENAAYLLTPDGQRRVADAYETTRHSEQEVGIAYLFDAPDGLAGMKFVYETPTVFLKLPVAFELADLELP